MLMPNNFKNDFETFVSTKTMQDINRDPYLIFNYTDREKAISISIVFIKDLGSIDVSGYESVILQRKGAVFILPSFWITAQKDLTSNYVCYIIEEFYKTQVSKWGKSV